MVFTQATERRSKRHVLTLAAVGLLGGALAAGLLGPRVA